MDTTPPTETPALAALMVATAITRTPGPVEAAERLASELLELCRGDVDERGTAGVDRFVAGCAHLGADELLLVKRAAGKARVWAREGRDAYARGVRNGDVRGGDQEWHARMVVATRLLHVRVSEAYRIARDERRAA